jgi:membrane protease subunit (stomatin/prohibitin family)
VQKKIDERASMSALGDMDKYMRYKAAEALPDAAKQPGGGAGQGMGLGLGFGYGQMMAGAISGQGGQQQGGAGGAAAGVVPCRKCGTPNPSGTKFCGNCGAQQQPAQQQGATVECPNCKAQTQAGAKFCADCGQSLAPKECQNCKEPLSPGAKFCANCGTQA